MEPCYSCGEDLRIVEKDIPESWWRDLSMSQHRGDSSGLLFAVHEECAKKYERTGTRIPAFGHTRGSLSMTVNRLYKVKDMSVNTEFMED